MDRRKFFGVVAASGAVVAVPGRRFVHDLDERVEALTGELLENTKGEVDVILRLYNVEPPWPEELKVEHHVTLSSISEDGVTYIGRSASILITELVGRTNKMTIALAAIPDYEKVIETRTYENSEHDTLTLLGHEFNGLLRMT